MDHVVIQMAKISQKGFSLYSFSILIDRFMEGKTEKDMRLSSLTPSRSLVINFPFTSGWRPIWQKHILWVLLKQVMYRDRPALFKDIKEWRLCSFFSHLFQYSITFMLLIMCLILNLNLSRFNFQPLVLGMLFLTRLSSPLLATIFCESFGTLESSYKATFFLTP